MWRQRTQSHKQWHGDREKRYLRLYWPLLEQQRYCRSQPALRSTPYSERERWAPLPNSTGVRKPHRRARNETSGCEDKNRHRGNKRERERNTKALQWFYRVTRRATNTTCTHTHTTETAVKAFQHEHRERVCVERSVSNPDTSKNGCK